MMRLDPTSGKWVPGPFRGAGNEWLDYLASAFNFAYDLINCNATFGGLRPDGTYDGVVGKVVNRVCYTGF